MVRFPEFVTAKVLPSRRYLLRDVVEHFHKRDSNWYLGTFHIFVGKNKFILGVLK